MDLIDVEEEGRGRDAPRHEEFVARPESEDRPVEGVEEENDEAVAQAEHEAVELRDPDAERDQEQGRQD